MAGLWLNWGVRVSDWVWETMLRGGVKAGDGAAGGNEKNEQSDFH